MSQGVSHIPRVTLDTTFADLYGDKKSSLTLSTQELNRYVNSKGKGTSKYCYYDVDIEGRSPRGDETSRGIHDVYMKGQRNAFVAGNMKVVIFTSLPQSDTNDGKADTVATLDGLNVDQQPKIVFANSPDAIQLPEHWKLAPALPVDCLEKYNLLVSLDVHYEILSKRGLATSDLPNPVSILLDFDTRGQATGFEKSIHTEGVYSVIQGYTLPFVVKLQQNISGYGTFIVNNEDVRFDTIAHLMWVFPEILRRVSVENIHLHPATVVISELIPSDRSMAVSFFVRPDGEASFISGTWRNSDSASNFDGCIVNYSEQDWIKGEVSELLNRVAKFVHSKGYYGPVGIYVLKKNTGELIIVDLKLRTCASHVVGLLRGHFETRGLQWAGLKESVKVPFNRAEFIEVVRQEMMKGLLVIVAWREDNKGGGSWVSFVVGAGSEESLMGCMRYVQELKAPVAPAGPSQENRSVLVVGAEYS